MAITTTQHLLTGTWSTEVTALETAVGRFESDRPLRNDCEIAFFEIVRDRQLHVNVTHRYRTKTMRGWAGPASLPQGFVHNRTFGDAQPGEIVRCVREMVFAARVR